MGWLRVFLAKQTYAKTLTCTYCPLVHPNGSQIWNGGKMSVSALFKSYKSTDRIKWWERAIPSSSIRSKTSFTEVSYFGDQQCPWVDLSVAAACAVVFSKHGHRALEGWPWMDGIKDFDSMAIKACFNQSCCTPQLRVPASSLAFALALEDELNLAVSNFWRALELPWSCTYVLGELLVGLPAPSPACWMPLDKTLHLSVL